jgi:hypothetical protein
VSGGRGVETKYRGEKQPDCVKGVPVTVTLSPHHEAAAKLLASGRKCIIAQYLSQLLAQAIQSEVEDVGGMRLGALLGTVKVGGGHDGV